MVAILVVVIAAATYFGLTFAEGDEGPVKQQDELTVQEVFSSSARREVAAAEPVRALPRTAFETVAGDSQTAPSDADAMEQDWQVSDEDWNAPAEIDDSADAADTASDAEQDFGAAESAEQEPEPAADEAEPEPYQAETQQPEVAAASKPEVVDARPRPSAEALVAWWKDAGAGLGVRFVGALERGQDKAADGVAVMFSESVAPQRADEHLVLKDAKGQRVTGNWKRGANPMLLLRDDLPQGRYELTIREGLTSESGKRLQKQVQGPVFVY